MFDTVIRRGVVVAAERVLEADVAVSGDKIAAVAARGSELPAKEYVDATGLLVFPGAIDCHAHLNDPGYTWREDFAHGTAAAAVGGVTTLIDMPIQNTPALTDAGILKAKLAAIGSQAHVDYALWGGMTGQSIEALEGMAEGGCVAFKAFMSPVSDDYSTLTVGQMREAMEILKRLGVRGGFHCEEYSVIKWEEERMKRAGRSDWRAYLDSRPLVAELISTRSVLEMARETGAKAHICHVSHPDVAELIRQAQREGLDVTGETCVHYLVYTEEDLIREGGLFKCSPPLRTVEARDRLWEYVLDGTLSCIGSDHSPSRADEKDAERHGVFGVWGGISGLQSCVQIFFNEAVTKRGLSPMLLANVFGKGPAAAFGLAHKGEIAVGFDADLLLLDPNREWEITNESLLYLNQASAFAGLRGKGLPVLTMLRGDMVARNGAVVGKLGYGKYLKPDIAEAFR